jgi:Flp pilus assembly protein TadG
MRARARTRRERRGAALLEAAFVLPVLFLILSGLFVFGLGAFQAQQTATLAREGARWASVRGTQYQLSTGLTAATPDSVYQNAIKPKAVGMDLSKLTYSVTWDDASKNPTYQTSATSNTYKINYVNVTVNYTWTPAAYFKKTARTFTSTSRVPLTY